MSNRRFPAFATRISLAMLLSVTAATGQLSPAGGSPPAEFDRSRVPTDLQPHVRALGSRIRSNGKERVVLQGEFADESGARSQAQVTLELPGRVRLDGMRADGAPILFDGENARSTGPGLTDRDQAILDAFALDSIEGLLGQASQGAAVRLIGRGFGPDPAKPEEAGGPVYDIFDVVFARPTRGDRPVESRQYYFDSGTGLLLSVFRNENGQVVETRFSGWRGIDGDLYPGRIEQYRGDRLVFRFDAQTATAVPAGDTAIFQVP